MIISSSLKKGLILSTLFLLMNGPSVLANCAQAPFHKSITCNCQPSAGSPTRVTRYTSPGDDKAEACNYCEEEFIGSQSPNCTYVSK